MKIDLFYTIESQKILEHCARAEQVVLLNAL